MSGLRSIRAQAGACDFVWHGETVSPPSHPPPSLSTALMNENRYPPLTRGGLLEAGADRLAVGQALFRPMLRQPVPAVLTAFDVTVDAVGYLYAPAQSGVPGGRVVGRAAPPSGAGATFEHFRPIQCLYREFDHSRGGHEAAYVVPTQEVRWWEVTCVNVSPIALPMHACGAPTSRAQCPAFLLTLPLPTPTASG